MIVLTDPEEIVAALEAPALVPPSSPDSSRGSTTRLRGSMARFSRPDDHAARRGAVVDAIARIDLARVRAAALAFTSSRLTGEPLDALAAIGRVVPTEALASCLGLSGAPARLVADVDALAAVIGRGEAATADSDAAVDRLLLLCRDHPAGAVAVVSLLYQNCDATAALVAATLASVATGRPAAPAVPRTRRVAVEGVVVAGHHIVAGSEVVVEIGSAGLPFGAGPHQCPGRELAEQLVAGIVAAIDDAGYVVDTTRLTIDPDGRPMYLPIQPTDGVDGGGATI